jgi:glycosyltransferase involved in cell wall biosynthesis
MNEDIFFSVVVPLYNKESSIIKTLRSVINQTYPGFELIIVDDGSTDNSIALIQELISDKRLHIIRHSNKGVAAARNTGIRNANYKFVLFLDADDVLDENALLVFRDLIIRYPGINVYTTNFWELSNGKKLPLLYCRGKEEKVVSNNFKEYWLQEIHVRTGNTVFSRYAIEKHGFFAEYLSYYEDQEFALRIIENELVVYSPNATFTYIKENSELSRGPKKIKESFGFWVDLRKKNLWQKMILAMTLHTTYRKVSGSMDDYIEFRKKYLREYWFVFISRILIRINRVAYEFFHINK